MKIDTTAFRNYTGRRPSGYGCWAIAPTPNADAAACVFIDAATMTELKTLAAARGLTGTWHLQP